MKEDKRSPLAFFRDQYFNSEEGKLSLDTSILKNPDMLKYLKNRLELAYDAGAKQFSASDDGRGIIIVGAESASAATILAAYDSGKHTHTDVNVCRTDVNLKDVKESVALPLVSETYYEPVSKKKRYNRKASNKFK